MTDSRPQVDLSGGQPNGCPFQDLQRRACLERLRFIRPMESIIKTPLTKQMDASRITINVGGTPYFQANQPKKIPPIKPKKMRPKDNTLGLPLALSLQ